jgi:tetratricopeptide (TPR) repeat protein
MANPRKRHRFGACVTCLVTVSAVSSATIVLHAEPFDLVPPVPPSAKFNQAIELLSKGQLKEADALFQKVTETEPGYLDAELGRAQIALTEQRLDEANRMVTAVLSRQSTLPEAHNMKGLVLLLQKHSDAARREFSRALELRPDYITPRLYLAVLARAANDYTRAAAEYKALTEIAPRLPAGYLGEAESQMLLRHEAEGLKTLEEWKTADPKSLLPYHVLANVNLSDHQPQKAIQQLQAALAKSPHDSTTLTILGTAYAASGDLRSATAQYEAALAANSANTDAAIRLGGIEAGTGQTDRALAHFRGALKADPNNLVACNNVAWLLADKGKDLDEASRLAELVTRRDPKYADGRDTLGWVRYRQGQYAQAVTALQEAKALAPSNTDIAGRLGLAYAKAGHKQEALAELKRALASGSKPSNRPELERMVAELSTSSSSR